MEDEMRTSLGVSQVTFVRELQEDIFRATAELRAVNDRTCELLDRFHGKMPHTVPTVANEPGEGDKATCARATRELWAEVQRAVELGAACEEIV